MNELKVFNSSEFGELSVMLIDGKEYFPFMIVCNQLAEFLNEDMKKRLV